jgi:hypothetical protein
MSYHDNKCVCGRKKPTDTLLCDDCLRDAEPAYLRAYSSPEQFGRDYRRTAAIRLLSAARLKRHGWRD